MNGNIARARQVIIQLANAGVHEVILCAGARNAPLVALLNQVTDIHVYRFFEERSAGFFAIGRMQSTNRPVAVCTTSGTAVAELLPAVIEADHQGLPLVVVSADRPAGYRGSGSPQTIMQPGIFSHFVERSWDLDGGAEFRIEVGARPVHVNICFDEPLLDEPVAPWTAEPVVPAEIEPVVAPGKDVQVACRQPLVVVGGLAPGDAAVLKAVLKRWGRPLYLEALSQLRGDPDLADLEILGGEESIRQIRHDGVIRIGDVPTLRYWRDLEKNRLPVWNFSRRPWSGLARERWVYDLSALARLTAEFTPWDWGERERDRAQASHLIELLGEFPLSEGAWVRRMSSWLPPESRLFLGNSLPIREWDFAAVRSARPRSFANRGTNGIDGLISTFLGVAEPGVSNWALIGDLSALYDLAGPWALRERPVGALNLCVINNGGGQIFTRIFKNRMFENAHDLGFENWARMWGWSYERLTSADQAPGACSGPRVLEIVPDPRHTEAFNNAWEKFTC